MICDNTVRRINEVRVIISEFALVWSHSAGLLHLLNDWHEKVRVVVRPLSLDDGQDPFQTDSCVDVVCRKRRERSVVLGPELDEHAIREFNHIWVIFVH